MAKIQNKVIVWGIDNFNTLGLIRELGMAGLDLIFLIKGKGKLAVQSKYCKMYIETKTIQEGYDYLIANYVNEVQKPIIIVSGDNIITYIDRHRTELEPYFLIPGTKDQGLVEKYIDKNNMTEYAKELGFLCPESLAITKDKTIGNICYPCIIKPSHEKAGHYNEFKFKVCKTKRQLQRTLKMVRSDSEFILQQYLPKDNDLLVYGGRMYDGEIVIAGGLVKERWSDNATTSYGRIVKDVNYYVDTNKIKKFLESIDYYGLFSVEYGICGGKAYFFEFNFRNDGTSHYFYQAGSNIPLAYVYSCAGVDYTSVSTVVDGDYIFMDEVFDIENVLRRKISYKKWHKEKEIATIYRYYDANDIEPWKIASKGRWKKIIFDSAVEKIRIYVVFFFDKLGLKK